jgi:hypothetical protein
LIKAAAHGSLGEGWKLTLPSMTAMRPTRVAGQMVLITASTTVIHVSNLLNGERSILAWDNVRGGSAIPAMLAPKRIFAVL